ncbi:hypothetical protein [Streptomyces nymphaeiformis]|uniref:Uncharacterized protein n=1 Tax=Streptomyces nymphaeiformis TaxID=2663842 RepID=A0A7W7U4M7_9ACTN|nr:hypothetical protein [Streptomyces nymphaeiformis]MBB4984983.1 hypothetical protein [Streptomyces nymphaeiformis]
MTQPTTDPLRNLADRAERGPLTGAEAARLRDGIDRLQTRAVKAERAVLLLADSHRHAERAEAALEAFRDRVQAITDEARGGIREQLGYALAALDAHTNPKDQT